MTREELLAYVRDRYGAEPEYLWESYPNACVFRHRSNRKWFAAVLDVRRSRLGLPGEDVVYVLNVKCGPLLSGSYLGQPGILPAWHMNKNNWLSVLLDGSAEDAVIRELLELSYDLTGTAGRPPKKRKAGRDT